MTAPDWGDPVIAHPGLLDGLPERTIQISADVRAFDAEQALAQTREVLDPAYWLDLDVDPRWIVIGDSGQGDQWLLGPRGDVWFFDHSQGERSVAGFEPMHLSVTEWLIAAHVLSRFERADAEDGFAEERAVAALEAISPELSERWPYALG